MASPLSVCFHICTSKLYNVFTPILLPVPSFQNITRTACLNSALLNHDLIHLVTSFNLSSQVLHVHSFQSGSLLSTSSHLNPLP